MDAWLAATKLDKPVPSTLYRFLFARTYWHVVKPKPRSHAASQIALVPGQELSYGDRQRAEAFACLAGSEESKSKTVSIVSIDD
jgi:hypothetical protein